MRSSLRLKHSEQDEPFAHGQEALRQMDRRGGARNYAVYRACRILRGSSQAIGIIRNTSEGGAEIQVAASFAVGEDIMYDDAHMGTLSARIVWARGDRIGVENIAVFPNGHGARRQHRAIRFDVGRTAKIWIGDRFETAHLQNISQTGACFLFDRGGIDARFGALASISIGGRAFRSSVLRWNRDAYAGFKFEAPYTLSELSDLLSELARGSRG